MNKLAVMLAVALLTSPCQMVAQQRDTARFRLAPIVVTVARTPIRLIDVPLAITVVDKEEMEGVSGQRIDEALRGVPGVLAQSRYGGTDVRIVIRGYGARGAGDRSNAGTTRGVRILQDGFPETEPDGRTAMDLIDLASTGRIEVVRSNASALWGNAAGGLINFSSLPSQAESSAQLQYQGGGFGLARTVATASNEFDDGLLYAAFAHTKLDGWRQHSDAQRMIANAGLRAELGDATLLSVHAVAADNQFSIPGPLTLAQYNADPRQANPTYQQRRERRRNRLGRLGVSLEHAWSASSAVTGAIFVNPKYLQRSERGTFREFTRYHIGGSASYQNHHTFGPGAKGTLVVGFDEAYQDGAILFYGLTSDGERNSRDLRDNKREGANNAGLYGQEILALGSRVELTLGARYDNITYYYESRINPGLNDRKSFERVTPKIGLLYRLSPQQSVYANLGGGVEAPAGNETDPAGTFGADTVYAINPLLEAIRSRTAEVGTRAVRSLSGPIRTLSYDVALYRTLVSNEIVPYRGGRFYFTAASAERMGAELGLAAQTRRGVSLKTAWTFADNRYQSYRVDSVHYDLAKAGHFADYSDNRIVGIPDRFFTIDAGYTPSFYRHIGLSVEMEKVGRYFVDDANLTAVPGYTLFGASIKLRDLRLSDKIVLKGIVRVENLADIRYVSSAFLNPDVVNGQAVAYEPGLPRHMVISLSLGRRR